MTTNLPELPVVAYPFRNAKIARAVAQKLDTGLGWLVLLDGKTVTTDHRPSHVMAMRDLVCQLNGWAY